MQNNIYNMPLKLCNTENRNAIKVERKGEEVLPSAERAVSSLNNATWWKLINVSAEVTGYSSDILIWEGLISKTHFFKMYFSNSFGENNDIFIFFVRRVCTIFPTRSQKSAGKKGHLEVIF